MSGNNKKKNVAPKPKVNKAQAQTQSQPQTQTQSNRSFQSSASDRRSASTLSERETIFPTADIAFRVFLSSNFCSAIWSHITDCDETFNYWEPSHFLLYGKGLQTWEYNPNYALRSYTYLLLYVIPAWLNYNILQPTRMMNFYFVRYVLGIFCALCETYFYKAVNKSFGNLIGGLVAAFLVFSPGMFISSTAFLPSSFSMYMCMLQMGAWLNEKYELAIFVSALSAFLSWPFHAISAVPLAIDMLFVQRQYRKFMMWSAISTQIIVVPMVEMDSELYGRLVVAPYNIIKYNIFHKEGPNLYGTEPYSFYLINGFLNFNFAFVIAMVTPFIIVARNVVMRLLNRYDDMFENTWLCISTFYIWFLIFSFQPHKEERFMFPVYPLLCLSAAVGVESIIVILIELRNRFRGRLLRKLVKPRYIAYGIILLTATFGISRVFGLYKGYHAPMDVYMELHKMHAEGKVSSNTPVNVCVGKEWYRFPTSFFLPGNNWNLKFIKSEFRGQLPAEYSRFQNSTAIVHTHFNNLNQEELSRYFNIENCHFLVDNDNGKYTALEPNYSADKERWRIYTSVPFLNNEKSHKFFRAFYVPFLSAKYTNYSNYMLLISNSFKLNEVESNDK